MNKILLSLLLVCLGMGVCVKANAKPRKRVTNMGVNIVRTKSPTKTRSVFLPIMGTISPDGNSIMLRSVLEMDVAYIVISGDNGMYYTDMVDFNFHTATLAISELEEGTYTITIEFESGDTYTGIFQLIEY